MRRRLLVLVLILAGAAGAWISRELLEGDGTGGPTEKELLYLPNGNYLKAASLGQAPLLADILYLWAIQYYSDYEREDRYLYVNHVFADVIAKLDPHYIDPYWLGAMILIVEAGDLEGGLALLDKGIETNPRAWILPYLAGWETHRSGQYLRAAAYFEKASAVADVPSFVRRLGAGMYARAGDLREAIRRWEEVLHDPRSDTAARAIAERRLRDLRVRLDLEELQKSLELFRNREGRNPRRLEELVRAGVMREVPIDPGGRPYAYDPATGRVSSRAGRILGGT